MLKPYVFLCIINLVIIFLNKNHVVSSALLALIWGSFFIKNIFVLYLLFLLVLMINTIATYIMKYKYGENDTIEKRPKYLYFLSVLVSVAIFSIDKDTNFLNKNMGTIKGLNLILIIYVVSSLLEFFIHKNIMHCDVHGILNRLSKKTTYTKKWVSDICETHLEHHKEVKPDMKLNISEEFQKVNGYNGLFMTWDLVPTLSFLLVIITLVINRLLKLSIKPFKIVIGVILLIIFWCYLWNKTHPNMHETELTIDISDGPIEKKTNLVKTTEILLGNHKNHHLQKGKMKGNFNVIFLGADEWLNRNVINIDNSEYCLTHQNEEICKK